MHPPSSPLLVTLWAVTSKLQGCTEESEVMCVSNSPRLVPRKAAL